MCVRMCVCVCVCVCVCARACFFLKNIKNISVCADMFFSLFVMFKEEHFAIFYGKESKYTVQHDLASDKACSRQLPEND